MLRRLPAFLGFLGLMLLFPVAGHGADLNKSLSDTESRRKAAENGLKEIKSKSPQQDDLVRKQYTEAATRQNVWLESVCASIAEGSSTSPDVSDAATSAAVSLVEWVNVRNRALGLPELAGDSVDVVKKSVTTDLVEIASRTWKGNRSGDAKKRASVAESLKTRLRWASFDEVK